MRFRNNATADREEAYQEWYESPYLQAMYQFGKHGYNPTYSESRIHLLYQLLKDRVMPWQWDHENYTGDNKDMYGYFYEEDINAILQIKYFEGQKK